MSTVRTKLEEKIVFNLIFFGHVGEQHTSTQPSIVSNLEKYLKELLKMAEISTTEC